MRSKARSELGSLNERRGKATLGLMDTMGSATGEAGRAVEPGGWAGTDDSVSTAPSDQLGNPPTPEEDKPYSVIVKDLSRMIDQEEAKASNWNLDTGGSPKPFSRLLSLMKAWRRRKRVSRQSLGRPPVN